MNDVSSRKAIPLCQLGLPCSTAAKTAAFLLKLGSGNPMDRTTHTAARKECLIGGVHDRVDVQRRNVGLNRAQCRGHDSEVQPQSAGG
jgi:hypothetical protein